AASHPALSSSDGLPANWTDLPPVFGGIGNFTVTAATQVLAKLSRQNLGIVEDEPGLVVWESGGRRGAAFLFWGTSRWRLQMATSPGGSEFYKGLLQRLRAWLVAPVEEQPVRIRPTKRLFSGSENIRFVGEIYGGGLQPRDDALVQVAVTSNSRTENVTLHGRGNGRYEGEMTSWTEGEYRFRGWATSGDDTLGTDRGMFAVEAFNIELVDTRARFDVLQQVSQASGGTFTTLDNADSVLENMDFSPRVTPVQKETTLWNRGLMIWLIIALLSLEWIIRKRSGML
ncbi:hypothetical protein KJ815_04395, partial [bacterium]|nr:hypothetical protein [bacterium]